MSNRTWRQIEDSRDRRLWFTQVVIPLGAGVMLWMADEERRNWTVEKIDQAKQWFVGKVQKVVNR